MDLREAIDLWLGEREQPNARRAMLLGAGFTLACESKAPLFRHYEENARKIVRDASLPGELASLLGPILEKTDITDLVELIDRHLGRAQVARLFLVDPIGDSMRLDNAAPLERKNTVYRTLKEWRGRIGDDRKLLDEAGLHPSSPHLLVARLVAEGAIDEVLTTNWDAYLELGMLLIGRRVEDADEATKNDDWCRFLPGGYRVVETADEMNVSWSPAAPAVPLWKLHGGIRKVLKCLHDAERGDAKADERLRRSFLAASSDLTRWRDASQWVADRVSTTLRSHATFTLGVSGIDNVTFDAFRQHFRAWEDSAERLHHPDTPVAPPRTVAVDFSPTLRLLNMMSVRAPLAPAQSQCVKANGPRTMEGLYARWLLRHLRADDELEAALDAELRDGEAAAPKPLAGLLARAIGPGARWAAIGLRRPPFHYEPSRVDLGARWWYAPWSETSTGGRAQRGMPQLRKLLDDLRRHGAPLDLDPVVDGKPQCGIVRARRDHPLLSGRGDGRWVLLAPWPWDSAAPFDPIALIKPMQCILKQYPAARPLHLCCIDWPRPCFDDTKAFLSRAVPEVHVVTPAGSP